MSTEKILITGSLGQIGSDLTEKLQKIFGIDNVIATDIKLQSNDFIGIYEILDVMNYSQIDMIIKKHKITTVYHVASLLSATSEQNPKLAWKLNINPLIYFLDLAKDKKIKKIFWPSSIAIFGKDTPKIQTPQFAVKTPSTVYGISKVAGENWCNYYHSKYKVDIRSIRYPGLISWKKNPGGGTTDYAVEIYHHAIQKEYYTCFIKKIHHYLCYIWMML